MSDNTKNTIIGAVAALGVGLLLKDGMQRSAAIVVDGVGRQQGGADADDATAPSAGWPTRPPGWRTATDPFPDTLSKLNPFRAYAPPPQPAR